MLCYLQASIGSSWPEYMSRSDFFTLSPDY